MASIVTGKLLNPNGQGLGNKSFRVSKAQTASRLPYGSATTFSTDSGGVFSMTLVPGLYLFVCGNDRLYFRVRDDGVTYNFGDITEPLK